MKDKPILFSTEMVKAILEERKTQTRRVIKPQPDHFHKFQDEILRPQIGDIEIKCPYQIGQTLWVREIWHYSKHKDVPYLRISYKASPDNGDNSEHWKPSIFMPRWASRINLEVTNIRVERLQQISEEDAKAEGIFFTDYGKICFHPKPCLLPNNHEYHNQKNGWNWKSSKSSDECLGSARFAFANLWNSINEKRRYSWDSNPWIWVIEFKKQEYTE